jgi:ribonuclease R
VIGEPTTVHRLQVVAATRAAGASGLTVGQLARRLFAGDPRAGSRDEVRSLLEEAENRGEVVLAGRDRFVAIEFSDLHAGNLRLTPRGFGVVRLEGEGVESIVVPPERLAGALDGDRVLARRRTRRRRGKLEVEKFGEVVRILERRRHTIVGRFVADRKHPWVDPYARRLNFRVALAPFAGPVPRDGEFVEVALDGIGEGGSATGRLTRRLGVAGERGVDESVVLADLGIPIEFPPAASREALALGDRVKAEEIEGRTDLRHLPAVTIDGETARDFDDAVSASRASGDAIEVLVHIADVSHYVRPGSALDAAARERGTSVYLPGRAIPMLPEELSNHLCSLVAGEERLAFTVRYLVTQNGAVEGYRAEKSVFRSRRRCTYTEVFEWLERGAWPAALAEEVRSSLECLDEAAARLRRRREERGAIDFDLPEPEILLDPDGFMTGIAAVERNRAHRLIEELMITANECVARMLVWGRTPGLFRVHERPAPGRLAELDAVLREFDLGLRGDLEELPPAELQRVLSEIIGRPEERFLQTLTLRALARASYEPSCKGHYALATQFYLHFTSPIRRYPDLVVHRFLTDLVAGRRLADAERERAQAELEELAPRCSFTERRAEEAEREVVRWKQAEYMRGHLGEEFTGHVTGVVAFGLFVQLDAVFVEGLVHVSALRDDYYRYDEAGHRLVGATGGRSFRLGDAVAVRVKGIDEEFMEVDLELVGGGRKASREEPPVSAKPKRQTPRRDPRERPTGRKTGTPPRRRPATRRGKRR